jgi:hypothetical protein
MGDLAWVLNGVGVLARSSTVVNDLEMLTTGECHIRYVEAWAACTYRVEALSYSLPMLHEHLVHSYPLHNAGMSEC